MGVFDFFENIKPDTSFVSGWKHKDIFVLKHSIKSCCDDGFFFSLGGYF